MHPKIHSPGVWGVGGKPILCMEMCITVQRQLVEAGSKSHNKIRHKHQRSGGVNLPLRTSYLWVESTTFLERGWFKYNLGWQNSLQVCALISGWSSLGLNIGPAIKTVVLVLRKSGEASMCVPSIRRALNQRNCLLALVISGCKRSHSVFYEE